MRMGSLIAVALVAFLPVIAIGAGAEEGTPPLLGHRDWFLQPGMTAEVDFELKRGAVVHGFFQTDADVQVETHQHIGDEIIVYGAGRGAAAKMRFDAPEDGLFSFSFEHLGEGQGELELHVAIRGGDGVEVVRWVIGATDPDPEPSTD